MSRGCGAWAWLLVDRTCRIKRPVTVQDFHLLVRLKVFNTEQMNGAVFAFRRYEDASLRYTGIESHEGLQHYGLYDTVVAKEAEPLQRGK